MNGNHVITNTHLTLQYNILISSDNSVETNQLCYENISPTTNILGMPIINSLMISSSLILKIPRLLIMELYNLKNKILYFYFV